MNRWESIVLEYLLNSLWQVPLLFAAAWLAGKVLRAHGPAGEHRVWATALLLEAALPACSAPPAGWLLRLLRFWRGPGPVSHGVRVLVELGPGHALTILPLPPALLLAVAAGYLLLVLYFVARVAWRIVRVAGVERRATRTVPAGAAAVTWVRCCRSFGIPEAALAVSDEIPGPAVIGVRRRTVLLPRELAGRLSEAELATVFAHELAHLRRRDFLKDLIYEFASAPVRYHPLCRLTRQRLLASREMVCDQVAAAHVGRPVYVASLLRLAALLVERRPAAAVRAIGIFDANTFERRLMRLTIDSIPTTPRRRIATAAACATLAVATCTSAVALRVPVNAAAPSTADHAVVSRDHAAVTVPGGEMAGHSVSKVAPVYPDRAKQARVQGSVVLHAVIGEDGSVQDLKVVSGSSLLRASAMDAVRQWTYKPYLLDGRPVPVETTITVTYQLGK